MKRLIPFFLLFSGFAFGQTAGIVTQPKSVLSVVNGLMRPVANATITVCAANTGGIPCSPALVGATFKDAALTQPLSNPFTTDANGNYQFAAAPGNYTITETGFGFLGYSYQLTLGGLAGNAGAPLGSLQGNCGGTFCGVPGTIVNSVTGQITTTNLFGANGGGSFAGTFTGSPTFSGGVTIPSPGPIGGTAPNTGGFTTGTFTSNVLIAGPRPWIDVTSATYGADPTGAVDSTAAFTSANAACAGGTMKVPPGTYIFSSAWTINTSCNIVGESGYGARPILRKNFNSGLQGWIKIVNGSSTLNNVSLVNLELDGNSGSFSGYCIVDNPATSARHSFIGNYIHNCEGVGFVLSPQGVATLSDVRISDNDIVCGTGAISGNADAIIGSQNLQHVLIHHNRINCVANVQTPAAAIAIHSSDSVTTNNIAHITIDDNEINPPTSTGGTNSAWAIELGTFQGYASQDIVIKGNRVLLLACCAGGFSLQQNIGLVVSGNNYDSNGFNIQYSALEMIGNFGTIVSNNHFICENSSSTIQTACIVAEDDQATISTNTIDGFGENGTAGASAIVIGGTHAGQNITSMSMSGGVISITLTTPPLNSWFVPGTVGFISGSTTTGYNGYCKFINTGYVRASGTIQCATSVITAGDAASCSSGCGAAALSFAQSNNAVTGNVITFPVKALTSSGGAPLVGIDIRPGSATEIASNNQVVGNTIIALNGTVVTGTIGVALRGSGTIDSTIVANNNFINLANGIQQNNGTNAQLLNNTFLNVTIPENIASGTVAASTWPLVFSKYNACATGMDGFRGEVTDNNTAVAFGATVTGGGVTTAVASHVSMRCNGASAGPKWTITGN